MPKFVSFLTATCFTIAVFAIPFYALGASADAAFRISALWLLASIPFGCAVGRHLRRRNKSAREALLINITAGHGDRLFFLYFLSANSHELAD